MNKADTDQIRTPNEVARRALALFGVWGFTTGAPRDDILAWLDDTGLRSDLTPREQDFAANLNPTERQRIYFSWQAERLVVLLWALNVVEELPPPAEKCDVRIFRDYLPPFTDEPTDNFVLRARLRSQEELSEQLDRIYDLHVEAADARRNKRPPSEPVDIQIIFERHSAINWITGYCGEAWDDVAADI